MKNLHLIPTEKPSRLVIDTIENKLYLQPILHKKTINVLPQHIYITSDEVIKKSDWCLNPKTNKVIKVGHHGHYGYSSKKIILTTDQDLIADGVQAIDDTFLEWFVKNPSCESVEVERGFLTFTGWVKSKETVPKNLIRCKIIIPQEEPKHPKVLSENGNELFFDEQGNLIKEEPKQETIEEAAREYWKRGQFGLEKAADTELAFLKGAKSDAARDYWFEQFKKKGGDK